MQPHIQVEAVTLACCTAHLCLAASIHVLYQLNIFFWYVALPRLVLVLSSGFPCVGVRLVYSSLRCTATFVIHFHWSLLLAFSLHFSSSSAFLILARASPDLLPRYSIVGFLYIYEGDSYVLLAFSVFLFCLLKDEDRIRGSSSWHKSKLAFMKNSSYYCILPRSRPGRGSNSRRPAHRSFKHGQTRP